MYIAYCLLLHFIADFILQPREMGRKKSSDSKYLFKHIGIIFAVFLVGTLDPVFALANAVIHLGIDAVIWKGYAASAWERRHSAPKSVSPAQGSWVIDDPNGLKKRWKYWEDHWFYVTIRLDQLLHTVTIVLLLEFL